MKGKLIQVNKDDLCPVCKRYGLVEQHGHQDIANGMVMIWHFYCGLCNAKFWVKE